MTWRPDYGNWPVVDAVYPFGVRAATENAPQTTAAIAADQGSDVLSMGDGNYVTYRRLNFGTREPLAFRIGAKSTGAGVIAVHEGGPGGPVLGSCEINASGEYGIFRGDILTAVSGLPDITFTYAGDGLLMLRDWQFVLPKQISYVDPEKIIQAADYPFRTGDIVRRPSTDSGSDAWMQVEGVTNGTAIIYDFVRFPIVNSIPFHIRAMPVAGGVVEIYAGEFKHDAGIFYYDTFPLGRIEIGGESGVWADYTCDLDFYNSNFVNYLITDYIPRWDLALVFSGAEGEELFAVSEFYIGNEKPGPAPTLDPKVKTGSARDITLVSAVVEGSSYVEIEPDDILEAGVMYFGFGHDYWEALKQTAADPTSPFTVTLNLQPGDETCYRAYVETVNGTYVGGVKRIFTPPDPTELRALYYECVEFVEDAYTEASWAPFAAALQAAAELLENINPKQYQFEFTKAWEELYITKYFLVDRYHAYTLTVIGGSGGGVYSPYHHIAVTADEPEPGKRFDHWEADGLELSDEDKTKANIAIFLPYQDVTLTAVWKDIAVKPEPEPEIVITGVNAGNKQADINFAIKSPNGNGYAVYITTAGAEGPFSKYGDVSYNSKGAKIKGLINGREYFIYIEYKDGKGNITKSKVVSFMSGK